jgi:predicted pyridoxine 5'-phosphate oxidase superfamily flavin-nucleotide-binding protein
MVQLTPEIKEMFEKVPAFPLATASSSGDPNVVPIKSVWLIDDETISICDNFMKKSLANLQENPRASISVWGPGTKGCIQIKGDIEIQTSGEAYDEMRARIRAKSDKNPAKSLLIMKITEVYICTPGPDAGKKIL